MKISIGMLKPMLLALPLMLGTMAAHALPIKTALGIVIDGSGSIAPADFTTQRNAYASVFGNGTIVPADGSVVVNVIQFSSGAQLEQTAIRLNAEADRTTLLAAINGMTQLGGNTNIGGGIALSQSDMDAFLAPLAASEFTSDFRKLIDVSTDGFHNTGLNPTTATTAAIAAGYAAVNCLGIGTFADCSWNLGGQDFTADTFAQVEAVLTRKVATELDTIPEPGLLALFGMGLLGFGMKRRRTA